MYWPQPAVLPFRLAAGNLQRKDSWIGSRFWTEVSKTLLLSAHSTQCSSCTCCVPRILSQSCNQIRIRIGLVLTTLSKRLGGTFGSLSSFGHCPIFQRPSQPYCTEAHENVLVLDFTFASHNLRDMDRSRLRRFPVNILCCGPVSLLDAPNHLPPTLILQVHLLTPLAVLDLSCRSELLAMAPCHSLRPWPLHQSPHLA